MRFDSAVATLEPQKYVIAGTVGTENILLVSGRLVCNREGRDCENVTNQRRFVSHNLACTGFILKR